MDNIKGEIDPDISNFNSFVYKPGRLNFRNGQSYRDMCNPQSTNVFRYNPNSPIISKSPSSLTSFAPPPTPTKFHNTG